MTTQPRKYKIWPVRDGLDIVLVHMKSASGMGKDVPCFQASAFTPEDKATLSDLQTLKNAIGASADWADIQTSTLPDHYKAQHGFVQDKHIQLRSGGIFIPLDNNNLSIGITITKDRNVITPFVWFTEGTTNVQWGWFEAACKAAIDIMKNK